MPLLDYLATRRRRIQLNIVIRNACCSDVGQISKLCIRHAEFEQTDLGCEFDQERLAGILFEDSPRLHCLVVENGEQLVGYLTFTVQVSTWRAGHYLYLDCLYLEPGYRGLGIGTRMMEAVVSEAAKLDCSQIQWQTPGFNERAIRFYRRLGATGDSKVRFTWQQESPMSQMPNVISK